MTTSSTHTPSRHAAPLLPLVQDDLAEEFVGGGVGDGVGDGEVEAVGGGGPGAVPAPQPAQGPAFSPARTGFVEKSLIGRLCPTRRVGHRWVF
ncbi:hypothetical protein ABZZ74_20545 [Streptomyces sp. NPDC006476]|uniref:hypothetical protein n=1 Tax=Streptomyces sp. NPDC006476 TaxID=3157175 RepID=UPI0033BB93BD